MQAERQGRWAAKVHLDSFFRQGDEKFFGGNHRHDQIVGLLQSAGIEVLYTSLDTDTVPRWRAGIAALRHLARREFVRPSMLQQLGYTGKVWVNLEEHFRNHPAVRCLIWESTGRWAVPFAAARHRLAVVAVPHNVESVGAGPGCEPLLGKSQLYGLKFEADLYRRAAITFCICDAEQWLLANLGIPAELLPYYPAEELALQLREVRARRGDTPPGGYLVMGNAGHTPNRAGMAVLLENLQRILAGTDVVVDVVGGGTLEHFSRLAGRNLRVHGQVARDELHRLKAGARGLLLYQAWGGGALTRVPEALVAGVPVLVNLLAARSARHLPGVHVYYSWSQLRDMMVAGLPTPPPLPRPEAEEKRFVEAVRSLAMNS